jgi:hypothetical protein
MRFGLFCSAQASGDDLPPETGQGFRDYLDFNVEAEELGFHSSFLVEHHFTGWNQVSATLMLLTCLAMRTTRLRLGSAVMVLPWHNPVLLAEQAATLDLVSGGRLDLGVGKGYRHSEFTGFQSRRGRRRHGSRRPLMSSRDPGLSAPASHTAAGSGASRTLWSSRRRRNDRTRRSGWPPGARHRSASTRRGPAALGLGGVLPARAGELRVLPAKLGDQGSDFMCPRGSIPVGQSLSTASPPPAISTR